jgi:hypothetical protein
MDADVEDMVQSAPTICLKAWTCAVNQPVRQSGSCSCVRCCAETHLCTAFKVVLAVLQPQRPAVPAALALQPNEHARICPRTPEVTRVHLYTHTAWTRYLFASRQLPHLAAETMGMCHFCTSTSCCVPPGIGQTNRSSQTSGNCNAPATTWGCSCHSLWC